MALFGVFFVGQSFPITDSNFLRADNTHWVCPHTPPKLRCPIATCPVRGFVRPSDISPPCPLQVLDVAATVKPQYEDLKEVALFLPQPGGLDPSMGIGLYVSVGGSEWSYRGCVSVAHPSDVMPLQVQ